MACLFGHKWVGCKCSKCNTVRDTNHHYEYVPRDWKMKCSWCGAIIELPYDFRTLERIWDSVIRQPNESGELYQSCDQVISLAESFNEEMIIQMLLSKAFGSACFIKDLALIERISPDIYKNIVLTEPMKLQHATPKYFQGYTDIGFLTYCLKHIHIANDHKITAAILGRLASLNAGEALKECLCDMLQMELYTRFDVGYLVHIVEVLDEVSLAFVVDFAIKNKVRLNESLFLAAKKTKSSKTVENLARYAGLSSGVGHFNAELLGMINNQSMLAEIACSQLFPHSELAFKGITEQAAFEYIALHDTRYHWFADAVQRLTDTNSIIRIITGETNMDDVQAESGPPYCKSRWYVAMSVLSFSESDKSHIRVLLSINDVDEITDFFKRIK